MVIWTWTPLIAAVAVAATALMLAAPGMGRATLPFGVRIPPDRVGDPAVLAARRGYRTATLLLGAVLLALGAAALPAAGPTAAMGAVAAAGVAGHLALRVRGHRAVAAAKREGDWYRGLTQAVAVDTGLRTDPVRSPWALLLPSWALVAATLTAGLLLYPDLPAELTVAVEHQGGERLVRTVETTPFSAFAAVFGQIAAAVLVPAAFAAALRSRPDIDAASPKRDAERYRRFLVIAGRCTAGAVFGAVLCLAGVAALTWTGRMTDGPLVVAALAPGLVAVALCSAVPMLLGQGGRRLRAEVPEAETGLVQRDDDRFWRLGGLVYANREDPAVLVPERAMGVGWTLNLGSPVVLCIGAGLIVLLAGGAAAAAAGMLSLPGGADFYGWKWEP
ncbi:DUF1648 domain-containing protein [Nocardiopsis potens]|uniref:DUF1648 domain-containing protein n=1 Tax=Nocardiopsis potens TaxID=1246458 RepID=UPI00034CAF70|nr:DUF5808 domain-containing protein [Nocardiopsis potens]